VFSELGEPFGRRDVQDACREEIADFRFQIADIPVKETETMSRLRKIYRASRLVPIVIALAGLCIPAMLRAQQSDGKATLASWKDGQAKTAIIEFVRQVTDKSGPKYVKPEERVAAFDDDGTVWTEWPRHINQVQMVFARQRVKQLAGSHKDWRYTQPFKAILDDDDKALAVALQDFWNKLDLLRETHGGMTVDEFGDTVRNFLANAKHPKFKVPFTQVSYPPMLELISFLRANDFKVYIVTGGGADFIRELSEGVFGVPRECVIGSTPEYEYKETAQGGYLVRKSNVDVLNENAGKAENLQLHVGRRPILVAGNSDGDLAMMGFAAGGKNPFLNLLIRHDDAEREFAYDDNTAKAVESARTRGWTMVSMKNDFKTVFSFKEAP
jgi:phosphoserine phosphatase